MKYTNITLAAPTTTVVQSQAGTLHRIVINKAAANGVITIYDGIDANGTVIGTITMPATLLQSQLFLDFGADLKRGLTIVTSAAAQDITVVTSGQS